MREELPTTKTYAARGLDRGLPTDSRCHVAFRDSKLPRHLHSAFLLGTVIAILRDLGESTESETRTIVLSRSGWTKLKQFVQLRPDDDVGAEVRAVGLHARELCGRLPCTLTERLAEVTFDTDEFAVQVRDSNLALSA